jgi:hypothetical protein
MHLLVFYKGIVILVLLPFFLKSRYYGIVYLKLYISASDCIEAQIAVLTMWLIGGIELWSGSK